MATSNSLSFGTKEWAQQNYNIQKGCENGCIYCYANTNGIRFKRLKPGEWGNISIREKSVQKKWRVSERSIMFPSSHDITENNIAESITTIKNIIDSNNKILIVSKPRLSCIKAICRNFIDHKDNILFRFSIGSADDKVLKFWEPNAPSFRERLNSLRWAFRKGFETSVSCEPMLDDNIHRVVRYTQRYVTETIWLGKVNDGYPRIRMNGFATPEVIEKVRELDAMQSDENIISLYDRYKDDPKIMYKESIKKVLIDKGIMNLEEDANDNI